MNDVSSEMSVSLGTLRPLTPDIAEFVAEVRFGSKTEVARLGRHVGFAPENGHRQANPAYPKSARRRHGLAIKAIRAAASKARKILAIRVNVGTAV